MGERVQVSEMKGVFVSHNHDVVFDICVLFNVTPSLRINDTSYYLHKLSSEDRNVGLIPANPLYTSKTVFTLAAALNDCEIFTVRCCPYLNSMI